VWDRPLGDAPFAFVDLEMTGLDPARDRVVQLCIERTVGGRVAERLASFVRPEGGSLDGREGGELGGSAVHGIGVAVLATAPAFGELVAALDSVLDGAVLVAHGAKWDIAFLHHELSRVGRPWTCEHHLDTLALARRVLNGTNHRLTSLAQELGIPNPRPHRADNDVTVLRALFDVLVDRVDVSTVRELWELCRGRLPVSSATLAAADRAVALRKLAKVCYRPSGRGLQTLMFQATAVRRDLDPPVVLGYLHPTRGRRELRADRILTFELIGHELPT
jgi:DNA polymerase-3 subunit epsilon